MTRIRQPGVRVVRVHRPGDTIVGDGGTADAAELAARLSRTIEALRIGELTLVCPDTGIRAGEHADHCVCGPDDLGAVSHPQASISRAHVDAKLALGSSAYEAGAYAERIPQSQPGTGYVIDGDTGDIIRFRTFLVEDEVIRHIAQTYAASSEAEAAQ